MSLINLKNVVLEAIRFYGQMSVQEIIYLLIEDPRWIVKVVKEFDLKKDLKSKIKKCLRLLIKEGNIREYVCESGYRWRYGISELELSKKIQLKLKEFPKIKNCEECYFPVVVYKGKKKHILPYSCRTRKNEDNAYLKILFSSDMRFIIYKFTFLGILEKDRIRLPYIDNKKYIPEFFIAIEKFNNINGRRNLTLKFKEVII